MSVRVRLARKTFRVRDDCSLALEVTSTSDLNVGDKVEVQFPNTWYVLTGPSFTRELQTADSAKPHYVSVDAPGSRARFDVKIRKRHLPFSRCAARHGRLIVATVAAGSVPAGAPVVISYANTFAPYVAETETVWLRVNGEAPDEPPAVTVTAGPAEYVRVIAPSGVEPGEKFNVLVVSLDSFDNRSSSAFAGEKLALSDGAVLADGLDFTGSVSVPVTIATQGVYRFECCCATSNAVRVAPGARGPYWGDIHIHTKLSSDGQGTDPYRYAREVSGLDFAAAADHWQSLGEPGCDVLLEWAREAYEPGVFVTILGDERSPTELMGHHNVYFRDEQTFMAQRSLAAGRRAGDGAIAEAEWRNLPPDKAMLVPHHTGIAWGDLPEDGVGGAIDFAAVDDKGLRPAVEIYSHHGQSECYAPQHVLSYEFTRMRNPERRANTSVPGPFYAQDWWKAGHRLGVVASSDEHTAQGGRRRCGVTAVWSHELTREGIFDAIRARRTYATTGERMFVDFSVDGQPMGSAVKKRRGGRVRIRLEVHATDIILRAEILRLRFGHDGSFLPILSEAPRPETTDASFELEDEITAEGLYYARITQEPLSWPGMAWTSPVWVELA